MRNSCYTSSYRQPVSLVVEWVLIGGLAMQDKLHEIRVFENFQEELFETGHVIVTTEVVEKSLNYFGNAHGGYLFTLLP